MSEIEGKTILVVRGLTAAEHQSLLYAIDEETVSLESAGIPPTAMGDFGAVALVWVATLGLVGRILSWVERQKTPVEMEFEFLKIVKLKVKKGATQAAIAEAVEKAGLPLEPPQ